MNIFKRIGKFFNKFFSRPNQIRLAKDIAGALVSFSNDTAAVNIISYVFEVLEPAPAISLKIAKKFILEASPVLFRVFSIMDASDESKLDEKNITKVCEEFNKLGKIADKESLQKCVTRFIKNDGKLSFDEAYKLVVNNLK
jgi:hypothetical protein